LFFLQLLQQLEHPARPSAQRTTGVQGDFAAPALATTARPAIANIANQLQQKQPQQPKQQRENGDGCCSRQGRSGACNRNYLAASHHKIPLRKNVKYGPQAFDFPGSLQLLLLEGAAYRVKLPTKG